MKLRYTDAAGNEISIEERDSGIYRIYGTTKDYRWREWIATSREIPNIEMFLKEFQVLGDLIIGQIVGTPART